MGPIRAILPRTARRRAAAKGAHRAAEALWASDLVACAWLSQGRLRHATPAMGALLGLRPEGGDLLDDHVVPESRDRLGRALAEARRAASVVVRCDLVGPGRAAFTAELRIARGSGDAWLVMVTDLSAQMATEQRLRQAAHYDALTGLPNRILLQDRLVHGLAVAARRGRMMALLVADLDGFKAVNDAHGHAAGDAVLNAVARRFASCVRDEDTLARFGGDEFVVVLPEVRRHDDAALLAARMVNVLRPDIPIGTLTVSVGTSIGIAVYPDDGATIESLFAGADAAMYRSKEAGRNRFAFADASAATLHGPAQAAWSAEWRLGVDEMDSEHRMLFTLLEDFGRTLQEPAAPASLRAQMRTLVDFAAGHFDTEERLMAAAGFAGLAGHHAEHQRLLGELAELVDHTHRVGAALTLRFLRDWLIGHMQTYDRAAAQAICAARAGRRARARNHGRVRRERQRAAATLAR